MIEKARKFYAILEEKVCVNPLHHSLLNQKHTLTPINKQAFCHIAFGLGLASP